MSEYRGAVLVFTALLPWLPPLDLLFWQQREQRDVQLTVKGGYFHVECKRVNARSHSWVRRNQTPPLL